MRCFYCDVRLTKAGGPAPLRKTDKTVDHVVPVSSPDYVRLTGFQRMLNKVECCHRCNNLKANHHPLLCFEFVGDKCVVGLTRKLTDLGFGYSEIQAALNARFIRVQSLQLEQMNT